MELSTGESLVNIHFTSSSPVNDIVVNASSYDSRGQCSNLPLFLYISNYCPSVYLYISFFFYIYLSFVCLSPSIYLVSIFINLSSICLSLCLYLYLSHLIPGLSSSLQIQNTELAWRAPPLAPPNPLWRRVRARRHEPFHGIILAKVWTALNTHTHAAEAETVIQASLAPMMEGAEIG